VRGFRPSPSNPMMKSGAAVPVVGGRGFVFARTAAEFREGHRCDLIVELVRLESFWIADETVGKLREQAGLRSGSGC